MSWHYQVMRHIYEEGEGEWYGVHEYYPYNKNQAGWSVTPILVADSIEDLKKILKMIEQDIYKHGVKDYE